LEELEEGILEYKSVEEFLTTIKKEFGRGEEESVKVAELKRLEQREKTMKEFCYGSRLKGLSQEATLVLSNTRELDRVPNTK